jgi:hypothetical protein
MEALVAIGLAGNVVQFVQGARDLISIVTAVRATGKPPSIPDLLKISEQLTGQANFLSRHLKASNATLAEEDQVNTSLYNHQAASDRSRTS